MKGLSFINKIILIFNYIAIICLLISYLTPYISPAKFWPIAFFGLIYPVLLVINILFIIYWILQWKRQFLYSLIAVLIGYNLIIKYIPPSWRSNTNSALGETDTSSFSVMSYNVKQFGLYNYNPDWSYNYEDRDKILSLLREELPDILCLQESFYEEKKQFITIDSILQFDKQYDCHRVNCKIDSTIRHTPGGHWGNVTFSIFPIINKSESIFNNTTNICFYIDVKIKQDTIRIFNIHLQSFRLEKHDYQFMKNIRDIDSKEELKKGFMQILRKMKKAFIIRANQSDILSQYIAESPYPVIVCGDFNDTPISYTYRKISKPALTDAFVKSGKGFGITYTEKFLPFRIDYILYSPQFYSLDFKTIRKKFSDHYPIKCRMYKK